jgi:hypothetical protein
MDGRPTLSQHVSTRGWKYKATTGDWGANNVPLPNASIQSFHDGWDSEVVVMIRPGMRQRTAAATRWRGIVGPASYVPSRTTSTRVVLSSTGVAKQS